MRLSRWGRRFGRLLTGRGRFGRLPQALVALGLILLLGFVVGLLLSRQPSRRAASAPVPTAAPPSSTAPPPATTGLPPATTAAPPPATTAPPSTGPPPGFAVWSVRVAPLTPFSATLAWKTTQPARSWASYGIKDAGATLWTPADDTSVDHQTTLSGLTFARTYTVTLFAAGAGEKAELTLDLTTPPLPAKVSASTDGGRLLLDGQPFFPLMVWGQCPAGYAAVLAAGIDLFGGNPCGGTQKQLDALAGGALSAGAIEEGTGDGPGLIGWYYPDEADAKHFTGGSLPSLPLAPGQVSFLTLTSHFYSGADPPSEGRSIYRGLAGRADVVGFDLYPLQDWCRTDRMAAVYEAQRELVQLAAGKPTFQWIESGGMRCDFPPFSISPDTVRAESWLAIAGGAHGLGFFPGWSQEVGQQVALIGREVKALGPALLTADAPVSVEPPGGPMITAARSYNGALYIIAVNPGSGPIQAKISAPSLGGRTLLVLDENRTVQPDGDTFSDDFAPLAVHVYLAPPAE